MTREEKLQQFAEQTTKGLYLDRHNLIQMVKAGAQWADETMIEKACEWLSMNIGHLLDSLGYKDFSINDDVAITDFIDEYRNAMKGGEK